MSTYSSKPSYFTWLFSSSMLIFVSSNFVNAGNLAFNMVFSRLMGPAMYSDLAFLLTMKLAIFGILNALQFLVTEQIANSDENEQGRLIYHYSILTKALTFAVFLILPASILLSHRWDWAERIGLSENAPLFIFFLGIPIYLPLAIWRGVAQGRIEIWKLLRSANFEMLVRLFGSVLLWWLGFGLNGVIFAVVLSMLVGWYCAKPDMIKNDSAELRPILQTPPIKRAWPWAALQLGAVLALDGDVLIAKVFLPAREAGMIAAISLIQRIIFFSCFSLASVFLPQCISEIRQGRTGLRRALPIFWLIVPVGALVSLGLKVFADEGVNFILGASFLPIADKLTLAAASATFLTLNYFFAVFMLAHKRYQFGVVFIALAVLQLLFMRTSFAFFDSSVVMLVHQKLIFQVISFSVLFVLTFRFLLKRKNI